MRSQEIHWQPDPELPIPLYQQIEQYIKDKIMQGEWTKGMRLPSQRALAVSFKVNRSTIIAALDELRAGGFIEGNYGGGTIVSRAGWNGMPVTVPDWEDYAESGTHYPNLPEVQEINDTEFSTTMNRLGTGELSPELLPNAEFSSIYAELARRQAHHLGYLEPQGSPGLRDAISTHLATQGISASPDSILIVSGSIQAMQLIAIGLLPRNASILVEKPSYLYSIHLFQSAGVRMIGMPMDHEGLRADRVQHYVQQYQPSLLYTIPSFQNPTGTVMSAARRSQLMNTAQNTGLPILEDSAYSELWFDTMPPPPLKALDPGGYVLHMGTLSKTVSPGLRIGWVTGPLPVIKRLADLKMQTDYGASSLAQDAAELWLREGYHDVHLHRTRLALQHRRDYVLELLQRHFAGLAEWNVPQGGFYMWIRLSSGIRSDKLFRRALAERILINPGNIYDRMEQDYIRLSYAFASLSELQAGIVTLAGIMRELAVS
ncbi:PLP-dependent aminotransferase family protein [Paenibacillus urinalis]|uniref:PLP-dependent aminotransferase family protein n=1 Tax=Paenibacillus urinalis TaxID=521520 RepID=A0ABY7XAZ8_9BACL|nr:PLP-dependent aminotransferase family protein [Paenibacillus urinalis]WDH98349.1 PLP-dependent aminotransferase family protein [Paenibacillus urinalis]WDI02039.1 PLP-dependent aminotransferase family protein [Paenibacillus urinalis]